MDVVHNERKGQRLRVAFIHQPWSVVEPPVKTSESVALWTDEIAHVLTASGECDVVCYARNWKGQAREHTHDGVEYRHVSVSLDRWARVFFTKLDDMGWRSPQRPFYASKWCYRQFISGVLADLKNDAAAGRAADVVHVQNFPQFVPMIRRVLPKARIVLHMHAEWLAQHDRTWIGPRIAAADSIIFCSDFFASQARRAWPEHAEKCRAIYNGVTPGEFAGNGAAAKEPGRLRLLYVGSVSPHKGIHTLVEAFNRVVEAVPGAELKIVGPLDVMPKSFCVGIADEPEVRALGRFYDSTVPYTEQLKAMMSPAAARRAEITGPLSRAELVEQFKAADVLVMPSTYPEGFGIPIVEAAAARVPAVCTRRGGMPEVVAEGETGLLVKHEDPEALAAAIVELLKDEGRRKGMGEAAYRRMRDHFTWPGIAEALLGEYQRNGRG